MSDFTPGPWKMADVSHNDKMVLIGSNWDASVEATKNGGMWVAQCIGPDRDANARLIAAAPEMLEALKLMIWRAEQEDCNWAQLYRAQDVVAKATGGAA